MAINLWEAAGKPTNYNPLPAGWGATIPLVPQTDYIMKFRAKSPTGATLQLQSSGKVYGSMVLTSGFQEYEIPFQVSTAASPGIFFYDSGSAGNIVIENITAVQKPLGKLTINGIEGFGTVKPGFTGRLSATADFKGKVTGDVVSNPHTAKYSANGSLTPPASFVSEANGTGSQSYDRLATLDGSLFAQAFSSVGQIAQQSFAFDIVYIIENQVGIPGASAMTRAEKIKWIKENFKQFTIDWWGWGSGPSGNKASLKMWSGMDQYFGTTFSHTQGVVSKLSITTSIESALDSNGFIYGIVYADACDGVTPSKIQTDFVTLSADMKQATVVDSKWVFWSNVKIVDDETLELTATDNYQASYIDYTGVIAGKEYTASHQDMGGKVYLKEYDAQGAIVFQPGGSSKSVTITAKPNTAKLRVNLDNGGSGVTGKVILKRPMLNMGSIPAPYEPKRGERMVMPAPRRNMLKSLTAQDMENAKFTYGDDYRIDVKTSTVAISYVYMAVEPFTEYTFSAEFEGGSDPVVNPAIAIYSEDALQSLASYSQEPRTINTGSRRWVRLYFRSSTDGAFKNYQFERSPIKTPFERYEARINQGLRRPKRNLLPPIQQWMDNSQGAGAKIGDYEIEITATTMGRHFKYYVPVVPGKNYVLSCEGNGYAYYYFTSGNNGTPDRITSTIQGAGKAPANALFAEVILNSNSAPDLYKFKNFQFEEGEVATSFEPRRIGAKRAISVAKKNLFNGTWEEGYLTSTNYLETPTAGSSGQRTSKWMPCKPNTAYTVSGNDRSSWHFKDKNGVIGNGAVGSLIKTPADAALMRVYYSSDGSHTQVQVEEGPVATPYESYKAVAKPTRKGLQLDGIFDRMEIKFPAGVLDALGSKKDFIIESVFVIDGPNATAASQQTVFSCGDIRFGLSSVGGGGIGMYTPATGWVDTGNPGQNFGKQTLLKIVVKPTKASVYVDGMFYKDVDYTGTINTVQTVAHIGTLGGGSYFMNGSIQAMRVTSEGVIISDIDFTDPNGKIGSTFKAKVGPDATIVGNPRQLNKLTKR